MSATDRLTIFALSSGRPPAAIAVVRISGPASGRALQTMIGRLPEPRRATLARVRDPAGSVIDQALALWFPAPNSETGEDMAELQLHGGRAVIAAVLTALGRLDGLRPAEPGEFTRRAFENGRIDLTVVEGLADLIAAETEMQRRQALQQLQGGLSGRAEAWRARLIEALALVEAGIDFSDEGDVPKNLLRDALAIVEPVAREIDDALEGAGRGERLREGYVVAIAGPPNSGKSTLLNRLARREAAIVSPFPGTTRDVIEVHFDLGGYPVTLLDTAGLRDSTDPVEQEGVRRARQSAARADLVLWVVDASADVAAALAEAEQVGGGAHRLVAVNKIDLLAPTERRRVEASLQGREAVHVISAASGEGADRLAAALARSAENYFSTEPALVTRERQRSALAETRRALGAALARGQGADPASIADDLVAEDLRLALRGLGRLTGRVDVEEILDVIFRDFCIGK
jgi:tRNA modification GTPase